MTKSKARIAIQHAADVLEDDWQALIKLRQLITECDANHEKETNPARARAISDVREDLFKMEARFNARIAAASDFIKGLEVATPYLGPDGTRSRQ